MFNFLLICYVFDNYFIKNNIIKQIVFLLNGFLGSIVKKLRASFSSVMINMIEKGILTCTVTSYNTWMCTGACVHACTFVCRSEDILKESTISFYQLECRNQTQVFVLGIQFFYLLSHLRAHRSKILYYIVFRTFKLVLENLSHTGHWPIVLQTLHDQKWCMEYLDFSPLLVQQFPFPHSIIIIHSLFFLFLVLSKIAPKLWEKFWNIIHVVSGLYCRPFYAFQWNLDKSPHPQHDFKLSHLPVSSLWSQ